MFPWGRSSEGFVILQARSRSLQCLQSWEVSHLSVSGIVVMFICRWTSLTSFLLGSTTSTSERRSQRSIWKSDRKLAGLEWRWSSESWNSSGNGSESRERRHHECKYLLIRCCIFTENSIVSSESVRRVVDTCSSQLLCLLFVTVFFARK